MPEHTDTPGTATLAEAHEALARLVELSVGHDEWREVCALVARVSATVDRAASEVAALREYILTQGLSLPADVSALAEAATALLDALDREDERKGGTVNADRAKAARNLRAALAPFTEEG